MTTVVNVKVKYIRPEYNNLVDWCQDENNVYIGRAGIVFCDGERFPKKASPWCNPYKVGKMYTREDALELYEQHLNRMLEDEETRNDFMLLRGKRLGCWCKEPGKDVACHGDVIVRKLQELLD